MDQELMHYGVLGMKWGMRKANNLAAKIQARKEHGKESVKEWKEIGKHHNKNVDKDIARDKKNTRAAIKKYEAKKNKIEQQLNSKSTKKTRDAVEKLSTGKAIAQSALLGSYGALVYNSLKAKNVSSGKAVANAIVANWANNLSFGQISKKVARW